MKTSPNYQATYDPVNNLVYVPLSGMVAAINASTNKVAHLIKGSLRHTQKSLELLDV